jgi:hypothetical protein
MPIETEIVMGTHPKIISCRPRRFCHSLYLSLIGLCFEMQRDSIPEALCVLSNLSAKLGMADDARSLREGLGELSVNTLVRLGEYLENPRRFSMIAVVGLRLKLPGYTWSPDSISKRISNTTSVTKNVTEVVGDAAQNPTYPHTNQTELGGALDGTSRFEPVLEVLRTIPLREYQGVTADPRWERDLADTLGANRDVAWLVSEAKRFRTWLEGQVESGKEPPNKNHRPRQRFCGHWLPRAMQENRGNGPNGNSESYAVQLARKTGVLRSSSPA